MCECFPFSWVSAGVQVLGRVFSLYRNCTYVMLQSEVLGSLLPVRPITASLGGWKWILVCVKIYFLKVELKRGETAIFYPLAYSSNGHSCWARPKPQASHAGAGPKDYPLLLSQAVLEVE